MSAITELCVLQVGHFQADIPHQVVINDCARGGGDKGRDKASEGSSFDGKNILFLLIGIFVAKGWGKFGNFVAAHHFKNNRWFFSDFLKTNPLYFTSLFSVAAGFYWASFTESRHIHQLITVIPSATRTCLNFHSFVFSNL